MQLRTKDFYVEKYDDEAGTVEGLAITYGNVDNQGDMVLPGAFADSVKSLNNKIKLLWQHDSKLPIGHLIDSKEKPEGLWVKFQFDTDETSQMARGKVKSGTITDFSIGFKPLEESLDANQKTKVYTKDGWITRAVNVIKKGILKEVSLVTFAADEKANVEAVKSDNETKGAVKMEEFKKKSIVLIENESIYDYIDALRKAVKEHAKTGVMGKVTVMPDDWMPDFNIREIYDGYVVCKNGEENYKLPFTRNLVGEFVFDAPVEVEWAWIEKSETGLRIKSAVHTELKTKAGKAISAGNLATLNMAHKCITDAGMHVKSLIDVNEGESLKPTEAEEVEKANNELLAKIDTLFKKLESKF